MYLPQTIHLFAQQIPLITVFIAAAALYYFFVIWYEGKKDGFDIERLFNLFFSAVIGALVVAELYRRYLTWASIYVYTSPFLKMDTSLNIVLAFYLVNLIIALIWSKRKKWSVYKIVDIFGLAASSSLAIISLGIALIFKQYTYLVLTFCILLLNRLFLIYRNYRVSSGFSFIIVNTVFGLYLLVVYKVAGHLLAGALLVTISLVLLYLRLKEKNMKTNLPADFLEHLKNKLINKDNELKKQEKLLKEEDPYMNPGRAEDNAEVMDEAILEDSSHIENDAKKSLISTVRLQIRKALAYMKIGKYGVCEICGNPIDKARLQIYPEATKCAECAAKVNQ